MWESHALDKVAHVRQPITERGHKETARACAVWENSNKHRVRRQCVYVWKAPRTADDSTVNQLIVQLLYKASGIAVPRELPGDENGD